MTLFDRLLHIIRLYRSQRRLIRTLKRYLLTALLTATIPYDMRAAEPAAQEHSCSVSMSPVNSGDTAFIISCEPRDTTAVLTVSVRGGLTNSYVIKIEGSGVTFLPVLAQDVASATAKSKPGPATARSRR